eukprot:Skav212272  [mRNA]  locus=scaffold732:173676:174977:- [translate_table: standard]
MRTGDIAHICDVDPAEVVMIVAQVKRLMKDPDELCCSISQSLFQNPVVAADGNTYELPAHAWNRFLFPSKACEIAMLTALMRHFQHQM